MEPTHQREALTMTPQAVYHWTRDDQDLALADVAGKNPDTGFVMPAPGSVHPAAHEPGHARPVRPTQRTLLAHHAGRRRRAEAALPFGNLPRLLLAWLCTEAVRTQSPRLRLGRSLGEFMRELGIQSSDSGGQYGVRTRLQNQMNRLFSAAVQMEYESAGRSSKVNSFIAEKADLWWNPRRLEEPVLWDSWIELGEPFYKEIIACPVPVDMAVLKALKRSSLGLDLYLWLTYKLFVLAEPTTLKWRQVYRQFGPHPENPTETAVTNFRVDAIRELKKLQIAWPDFKFALPIGGLRLQPTEPRIQPTTAPPI